VPRPRKNNAEYFSHDKDMRNDERMLAVRNKFQHVGYSIWNMILEKLTNAENFELKYDNKSLELWSGDFQSVLGAEIKEIVEYFIDLELLIEEDGMIFSPELKKRLQPVLDKRERARRDAEDQKRDDDGQFATDNPDDSDVPVAETPQSKVKQSKTNNIKPTTSPEAEELTVFLFQKIHEVNPAFRFDESVMKRKIATSAGDIDKMLRIDKRTRDQIMVVIDYVFGGEINGRTFPGDTFWQTNIESGLKLRKHFVRLVGKIGVDVKKEEESKGLSIRQ